MGQGVREGASGGWVGGVGIRGRAHPALNTAFEDVRGVGEEGGGRNGKSVTWCFTPSQPLLLYQGDLKERSSRCGWRRGGWGGAGGGGGVPDGVSLGVNDY